MTKGSSSNQSVNSGTTNDCNDTRANQTKFTSIDDSLDNSGEKEYIKSKRDLELLEERNRIRHKEILFYFLILFLISLFVATCFLIKFGFYFFAVFTGSLFIIILGILITYFIRKNDQNSEHLILNRFFDFASDLLFF